MKWGILGTSFISGVMAEAINADRSSALYAVAGRSQANVAAFAEQYNVLQSYLSYEALLDDPQVDIVYIALPNHLHHEFIAKAATCGKAILCEKSLSVDMEKSAQALAAVKHHQVFFAEGLMYLHHPLIASLVDILTSGEIGELRSVQASYIAAIDQFVNPESKGALYNLGCYPVSLLHLVVQTMLGNNALANCTLKAVGRQGADGNVCESSVLLTFGEHQSVTIHTAEDHGLQHHFRVLGSKGSVTMVSNPWLPTCENTISVEVYEASKREVKISAQGDAFSYQVRQVREAVEAGRSELAPPCATAEDSYQIMQLLTEWESATLR
ncbi:oxidoreductase [Photobacterium swingsii]|uniref:Gfo/Idh/MocA family oxidoreductase n=1 Tax=Photobacterium swingsii TaxID=680026 RepID=A0A0J8V8M8_9GAMM|nr:Gfo/Idh/MocA family oxidoreductase [Photobacterium swingsii]KMV29768.1 oxidoreductase [Photobacterium swingsii]PSW22844.1 gfo/Idh/MocA family oxidoreductase [Photobacterium swingsii]